MANQNVPNSNPAFDSIYNPSGFDGQVTSDRLRLGGIPEALKKDLIDFCRESLAGFKIPKKIEFCELPKTSTGKIQKFELRKKAKEITFPK